MKNFKDYFTDSNTKGMAIAIVILSIALLACMTWFSLTAAHYSANVVNTKNYPMMAVVVEADKEANIVICKDFNGFYWAFPYDGDGWTEGDVVSMIMNDRGTPNVQDDYIIDYRYDGWLEGWMDR